MYKQQSNIDYPKISLVQALLNASWPYQCRISRTALKIIETYSFTLFLVFCYNKCLGEVYKIIIIVHLNF